MNFGRGLECIGDDWDGGFSGGGVEIGDAYDVAGGGVGGAVGSEGEFVVGTEGVHGGDGGVAVAVGVRRCWGGGDGEANSAREGVHACIVGEC